MKWARARRGPCTETREIRRIILQENKTQNRYLSQLPLLPVFHMFYSPSFPSPENLRNMRVFAVRALDCFKYALSFGPITHSEQTQNTINQPNFRSTCHVGKQSFGDLEKCAHLESQLELGSSKNSHHMAGRVRVHSKDKRHPQKLTPTKRQKLISALVVRSTKLPNNRNKNVDQLARLLLVAAIANTHTNINLVPTSREQSWQYQLVIMS